MVADGGVVRGSVIVLLETRVVAENGAKQAHHEQCASSEDVLYLTRVKLCSSVLPLLSGWLKKMVTMESCAVAVICSV